MIRDFETGDFIDVKQYQVMNAVDSYRKYRFTTTLTFQYFITPAEAIAAASTFIRRLHRGLFGRYGWRNVDSLNGVAFLEFANIKRRRHGRDRGNCHFHFLIANHPSFEQHPIRALRSLQDAVGTAGSSLNYRKTAKLVSKLGTHVGLVSDRGAITYATKEAKHLSWWQQDRAFLIHGSGLVPWQIQLRPWWNMSTGPI